MLAVAAASWRSACAHVRPAQEQFRRQADGHGWWRGGNGRDGGQFGLQRFGWLSQQNTEPVNGNLERRFQCGHAGASGGENGAGLLHVEVAGQAVRETVLSNRQRLFLGADVVMGNFQPPLITARFDIVARDFAEQRDEDVALPEFSGGDLRLGRLQARRLPPNTSISQEASKPD